VQYIQPLILGIVQGVTEFLPISSSGHLILIPNLLGWEIQPLVYDTTLHLGTTFALIAFFWKDLVSITANFTKDFYSKRERFNEYSHYGKMAVYMILGSVPAGILGFIFGNRIEELFRNVLSVIIFLVLGSVLMHVAEFRTIMPWSKSKMPDYEGGEPALTLKKSFLVGLFQALAIFPGFSRSGTTISGGMLFGLTREYSARFSFLLSVPIIVAASIYKVVESIEVLNGISYFSLWIGFLSSFIAGFMAIKFMLAFLKKKSLYWFVVYRLILAGFLIYIFFFY